MNRSVPLLGALISAVILGGLIYFVSFRGEVFAQRSTVASTVVRTSESSPTDRGNAEFASAVARNLQLSRSLPWSFGGKSQIGWEIYEPLIKQTVGTDSSTGSREFAEAVSRWQRRNGVAPTGVVEADTLQALIRFWQSQRLGKSSPPAAESLLSAPIVEFFDQSRDPGMLQLERETYSAYKRLIAAASKDIGSGIRFTRSGELASGEKFLRIVSAYRSPAYQEALRRKEPGAGRGALAKFSAHSTGQALDIYVGGEPVSTKDANRLLQVQTPAYRWLVKNASRFGFYNYFYEPWHWEYVPHR